MPSAVPIRVGTAGWFYEDWNSIVYPGKPGRGFDRLGLMASLFDTNEINSSFYRIPSPRQTADWARRVAHNPRFAFTAKLYRGFTHEGKAGAADEKAFAQAMNPLARAGRLGCVLAQFPFSFHNTPENRVKLQRLLASFPGFPLATEFRHASWNTTEARELLAQRSAAFVNIDQPALEGNLPPTDHITAPLAYFRFHGRNAAKWFGPDTSNEQRYNYLYPEKELEPWIDRIRGSVARVAGLAERDPTSEPGIYAILNNHFRGQAVANAVQLQMMLTGKSRDVPETLRETYPALVPVTTAAATEPQRRLF
jgi:uncharacterized protein YecE (DUF72 family)